MADWRDGYWWSPDGLRLHYRDQPGPEDGPTLVCLPGLTRNARDFEGLAARMLGRARVVSLSFRGRGDSAHAKDPMTYVPLSYVADVRRLVEELAPVRPIAVGTSLGGLVALLLAGTGAVRFAGMVLNDVGPEIEAEGLARIRATVGRGGSWPTWIHAARALCETHGAAHPDNDIRDWLRMAKRLMRLDGGGRVVLDYDMRIAEPFRLPGGEAGIDLWPALDALAALPVLVVRGELSDILSRATADRMIARLPGARLATVPNVGHAPTLDEPAAVAAIDGFLLDIGRAAA